MGHDCRHYPFIEYSDRILRLFALLSFASPSVMSGYAIIFSIGFDKFISCEKPLFPGA